MDILVNYLVFIYILLGYVYGASDHR